MPYKVCVADDERYIRISLERRLALSPVATRFAGSAGDGAAAVELYRRERPDIFFMDIKMPELSGLEAIRAIRSEFPGATTKFVVISGYDDFPYLQQSIRLGVLNYVKKPIVQEELDDTLRLAVESLEAEAPHRAAADCEALPLEEFAKLHPLDRQPRSPSLLVAVHAAQGIPAAALQEAIRMLRREALAEQVHGILFRGLNQVAVFCLEGFPALRQNARLAASRICRCCGERAVFRLAEDETLQQALELLETRLNDRFGAAGRLVEAVPAPPPAPMDTDLLKIALERGQADNTRRQLAAILKRCVGEDGCEALGPAYRDIILLLLGIFAARRHPAPRTLEMELLWFALARFSAPEAILDSLCGYAEKLFALAPEADADRDTIDRVCAYLDEHYAGDTSLQALADTFFVSPTYLSKRFREKRGITITGYLEELRLTKARDLLCASGLSISEICALVGYNDANYFSRLFRKRFQVPPSRYSKAD